MFIASGIVVWLLRAPPKWIGKRMLGLAAIDQALVGGSLLGSLNLPLLSQIAIFFGKAGAFVFGSGLAILPFLYGGVVTEHHGLSDRQFVDAVAVAMITPGPVVIHPSSASLVLAHLGDSSVVVVDTHAKSVRGQVAGVSQVHGVLAAPGLGRIYATATGSDELVVIDAQSLAILACVPAGAYRAQSPERLFDLSRRRP